MITPLTEMTIGDTTYTVGDTVTVGAGKSKWTVAEFWFNATGEPMVTLSASVGYANTSVAIERLKTRVVSP